MDVLDVLEAEALQVVLYAVDAVVLVMAVVTLLVPEHVVNRVKVDASPSVLVDVLLHVPMDVQVAVLMDAQVHVKAVLAVVDAMDAEVVVKELAEETAEVLKPELVSHVLEIVIQDAKDAMDVQELV